MLEVGATSDSDSDIRREVYRDQVKSSGIDTDSDQPIDKVKPLDFLSSEDQDELNAKSKN
jgi:hypothetical protein